jgi:hypothetical protein
MDATIRARPGVKRQSWTFLSRPKKPQVGRAMHRGPGRAKGARPGARAGLGARVRAGWKGLGRVQGGGPSGGPG